MRYGGPIESVHGLARAQAALGHDVHVATTSVDGDRDSDVPLGRPVALDGVAVWYFRSPIGRRLYWSPAMARFHRRHVADFDVVHLHSVYLWPTNHAARQAVRAGVPYVLSPRGMLDPELIRRRSRFVKTTWIRMFEKWTVEHAAAVHFTSDIERRACVAVGLQPRVPVVIPNGIDCEHIPGAGATPAPPYVLYLGRLSWKKGIDRLLAALPHVGHLRLIVAGPDDEGLTPTLRRLARDVGVEAQVEFTGGVVGARKWDLLRGARCLVLPSRSENFGNVVLEALAAGCPAVITPQVGIAEYLAGATVVSSDEPTALAAAIAKVDRDEVLRERHRARGLSLVADLFSWSRIARETVDLYAAAAASRRAA
jgi:glycosyltransferase involved in cell wall biosynthesis